MSDEELRILKDKIVAYFNVISETKKTVRNFRKDSQ